MEAEAKVVDLEAEAVELERYIQGNGKAAVSGAKSLASSSGAIPSGSGTGKVTKGKKRAR